MTVAEYDRVANRRELAAARKRMKKHYGGIGIVAAAAALEVSTGHLSHALRGQVPPCSLLKLSDLRQIGVAK